MPYYQITTRGTSRHGENVWIVDGNREICVTYEYWPNTGHLFYAASIFRKAEPNYILTDEDLLNHEHTTAERFRIRPVDTYVKDHLEDLDLIHTIRYLMIHRGCKGPRIYKNNSSITNDTDLSSSSDVSDRSFLSENPEDLIPARTSPHDTDVMWGAAPGFQFVINVDSCPSFSKELLEGGQNRSVYVSWARYYNPNSGRHFIRYGASIYRNPKSITEEYWPNEKISTNHYETAQNRLTLCPVTISVGTDITWRLIYKETSSWCTIDSFASAIFNRKGGHVRIKGPRLNKSK